MPAAFQSGERELDDDRRHHAEHETRQEEDRRHVGNDSRKKRQPERAAGDRVRDDEDAETGNAAGHEDEAERSARGVPIRDEAAEEIATRHAREDDADDARPGVQRDADVRRHDAAGDQLDDERAGTADEGKKTGDPHRRGTLAWTLPPLDSCYAASRMTLPNGTRLGAYEITGLVASGGMGDVYRAHDAKLQRDVAIKVLVAAAGRCS